jgi:hypothetical protein
LCRCRGDEPKHEAQHEQSVQTIHVALLEWLRRASVKNVEIAFVLIREQ